MTTTPSPAQLRLVTAYCAEWASLVELAVAIRSGHPVDLAEIARNAKKNPAAVAAKLNAIIAALDAGDTQEQIIERGERDTLQTKAKARAAAADGYVAMNFRVAPELKDAVLSDFERIKNVMGYATMENCWDWLHGLVTDLSDEDIRHLAGIGQ